MIGQCPLSNLFPASCDQVRYKCRGHRGKTRSGTETNVSAAKTPPRGGEKWGAESPRARGWSNSCRGKKSCESVLRGTLLKGRSRPCLRSTSANFNLASKRGRPTKGLPRNGDRQVHVTPPCRTTSGAVG